MSRRFRHSCPWSSTSRPVGFNSATDALLEIAAVMIDSAGRRLRRGVRMSYHVRPFEGANLEAASLAVNGIDPFHPLRRPCRERTRSAHLHEIRQR
jgi:ribonuclease T